MSWVFCCFPSVESGREDCSNPFTMRQYCLLRQVKDKRGVSRGNGIVDTCEKRRLSSLLRLPRQIFFWLIPRNQSKRTRAKRGRCRNFDRRKFGKDCNSYKNIIVDETMRSTFVCVCMCCFLTRLELIISRDVKYVQISQHSRKTPQKVIKLNSIGAVLGKEVVKRRNYQCSCNKTQLSVSVNVFFHYLKYISVITLVQLIYFSN